MVWRLKLHDKTYDLLSSSPFAASGSIAVPLPPLHAAGLAPELVRSNRRNQALVRRALCASPNVTGAGLQEAFAKALREGRLRLALVVSDFQRVPPPLDWKCREETFNPSELEKPARGLILTSVDPRFVPSVDAEKLTMTWDVIGLVTEATLEIQATGHEPALVFSRPLSQAELAGGLRLWQWDGKTSVGSGELSGRYVNPLFAPYHVFIRFEDAHGGGKTDEKSTWVQYHSLSLKKGAWTADEELNPPTLPADIISPDSARFQRYKLNKLGYWAGPVTREVHDHDKSTKNHDHRLGRALSSYRAHISKYVSDSAMEQSALDRTRLGELLRELDMGTGRTESLDLHGDPFAHESDSARVFVELPWLSDAARHESERPEVDEALVNRPMIPVEVEIFLTGHKGTRVHAPEAIGPVRVNWQVLPQREDMNTLEDAPPRNLPKRYIEKVYASARYQDAGGANCPARHGGLIGDGEDWASAALLGNEHEPYVVESDAQKKVLYSRAYVDEHDLYPDRDGRAGFMFHPSRIGGDAYRITAELDFEGLPNAETLTAQHSHLELVRSGTFTVWRRSSFGTIAWPYEIAENQIQHAVAAFRQAYVELEVRSSKPVLNVLSQAAYEEATEPGFKLNEHGIFGGSVREQLPGESNADYPSVAAEVLEPYWRNYDVEKPPPPHELDDAVVLRWLRALALEGYHDFQVAFPGAVPVLVTQITRIPLDVGPQSQLWHDRRLFLPGETFSPAMCAIQHDADPVTLAHELGHAHLLQHSDTLGVTAVTPPKMEDHDTLDACLMSYRPGKRWFCGKCNLRLRGWAVGLFHARDRAP